MVIVSPLRIGLWDPFQMGVLWLINGGDPNYLLTGMILQAWPLKKHAWKFCCKFWLVVELNQHIWKIWVKMGSSSTILGVKIRNIWNHRLELVAAESFWLVRQKV